MINPSMCNEQIALELVKLSLSNDHANGKSPIQLFEEFVMKVYSAQNKARKQDE